MLLFQFLANLCALRHLVVQNLKSAYLNGTSRISVPQSSQGFLGSGFTVTLESASLVFDFFFFGLLRAVAFDWGSLIEEGSGISDVDQNFFENLSISEPRKFQNAARAALSEQSRKGTWDVLERLVGSLPLANKTLTGPIGTYI